MEAYQPIIIEAARVVLPVKDQIVELSQPDHVFQDSDSHDPDFFLPRPDWVLADR